ncbi:MADS-box protein JOINTLESS-like [Rutidosis leptorrhynchoides]|uniref:MADS-box protein JOINTLESS-like n=1 Tax=Rutidosis leptorrhynchoides TaxID=125765 RepID=UPI003A9990C8
MRMVRQKTQIKKIENLSARQVTFSKRRRGLFKKAQELSTMCDVDIALIVFSATGKLFHYSPLSINQVLERHKEQSRNVKELQQSSQELQIARRRSAMLSKELGERTRELSHLKGEDLHELDLKSLCKLEATIESRLVAVVKAKGDKMLKEISNLKKKGAQLLEENAYLKQQLADTISNGQKDIHDQCGHHHFLELTIRGLSSLDPPHNYNSSTDTCLKLGLPFTN